MILFLDTVSSLPEFSIIEDNKIIYSEKILKNYDDKMSDCIIPNYIALDSKFSLTNKLKLLICNTGPGSYTALRVGIAFLAGLSLSRKIDIKGLSCTELFHNEIKTKNLDKTAIYITSSNNQKFICLYDLNNNNYKILKTNNDINLSLIKDLPINLILTNDSLNLSEFNLSDIVQFKKIKFKELVINNLKKILESPKQDIIKPIYISNNQILN